MRTKTFTLVVLLSALPIMVVGAYIYRFGVNIPFWDQWDVVPLLIKRHQGLLTITDLFSLHNEHNEHRPFFPNLIWIGLAEITHYNVNAELWVNLMIAIGMFLFFIKNAVRTWVFFGINRPLLLVTLLSLLVFNLGQYESWLQGIQTIMFLCMACLICGMFLLADHTKTSSFIAALLLGVIANFSMASGLFYWPVGLVVLLITTPQELRSKKVFIWLLCSLIIIGLFLSIWTSDKLDLGYIFTHIPQYLLFILNFLGSPINTVASFAWIFGCISLGLSALIAIKIVKTRSWGETAPYLGITLFILLSAFSVAAGRMELGLEQARVSRYQTISVWYWATLLTLQPLLPIRNLFRNLFNAVIALSLLYLMFTGYINGQLGIYQRTLPAYQAVSSGKTISDETLALIYPYPDIARPRLEIVCKNHWSVCANLPSNK